MLMRRVKSVLVGVEYVWFKEDISTTWKEKNSLIYRDTEWKCNAIKNHVLKF